MSECTHDCSSCSESCSSRDPKSMIEKANGLSSVKKVIGVVSGKGGVGKSMVTSLLAVEMKRRGFNSGILDADITGPSVPKMFGLSGKRAEAGDIGIFPVMSATGIPIISVNLLLEDETDPVVWRGPVIAGAVKQFWTDVIWKDVDFLFVDMPPGTGDVPLTVFQSIPVDGIIIVTSPQDLVSLIVGKAVKMAKMMDIPVLGLVENMSYFECPDCKKKYEIYGESKLDETAREWGIAPLARLPINPKLSAASDRGMIELFEGDWLDAAAKKIEEIL
ncbi:MAG: P-loop NTPase [Acutalibacteraceae bacterium]